MIFSRSCDIKNENSDMYGVVGSKQRAPCHHAEAIEMSHSSLLILGSVCSPSFQHSCQWVSTFFNHFIKEPILCQKKIFRMKHGDKRMQNKGKQIRIIPVTEKSQNICMIDMPEGEKRMGNKEYCNKEFHTRKI